MIEAQSHPLEALRALRKLLQDPNDTEQAFRVVQSVDPGHLLRLYLRFASDPRGRALLDARPVLIETLASDERLAAMPEGSLGRAYLAFRQREGITADGLVAASHSQEREQLPPDLRFIVDRMRDTHDVWHVVVGCRTNLAGELAVLTFTAAQTGALGVGLLAMAGFVRSFQLPETLGRQGRQLVREAWRRGRAADWLPVADWEALLPRPLDEVRAALRVEPMPTYEPVYAQTLAA